MSPLVSTFIIYNTTISPSGKQLYIILYFPTLSRFLPSVKPCMVFISPFGGSKVKPSIADFILCFVGLSKALIYYAAFLVYLISIIFPSFLQWFSLAAFPLDIAFRQYYYSGVASLRCFHKTIILFLVFRCCYLVK